MQRKIEEAQRGGGSICAIRDDIMKMLTAAGLVYTQRVHVQHALCHESNRSGDGLLPVRCHELMRDIFQVGFSEELAIAIAFEIPHEEKRRKQVEEFNRRLVENSGGMLAPVHLGTAQIATVAGGHLTGGLRVVWGGMPSTVEGITEDGKLCAQKVIMKDKAFAEVLQSGLRYQIIRHQAEAAFPDLPDIFQEVGNIGGHLFRGESTTALLLKIHMKGAAQQRVSGHIDWNLVKALVVRSCPPNPSDVPEMCRYVASWSGSVSSPTLLLDLQEFTRGLTNVRSLRASLFAGLSDLQLGVGKGGRLRTAVLKAASAASERHCNSHGERTKLFTPGDIATLGVGKRNHALAMQADAMMHKARALMADAEAENHVPAAKATWMLGNLDVDLVLYIFKKLPKDKSYANMAQVGSHFYQELANAMGAMAERLDENPWACMSTTSTTPQSTLKRSKAALPICISQLDANAELQDFAEALDAKGFTTEVTIEREEDGKRFTIVSTTPRDVTVQSESGAKKGRTTIPADVCLERYKVVTAPSVTCVKSSALQAVCTTAHSDVRWELATSYVKIALCMLEREWKPRMKVVVTIAPMSARKVVAEQEIANGVCACLRHAVCRQ